MSLKRFAAMISHDGQGHEGSNHAKVARVHQALRRLGLDCWFDDGQINESIHERMVEGIDSSEGFLAFVTKRYHDNCKFEFRMALKRKSVENMVAVVMEEEMRNLDDWKNLMAALAPRIFFDLCDLDCLSDLELDNKLKYSLIPLMTWLTPDSYTTELLSADDDQGVNVFAYVNCKRNVLVGFFLFISVVSLLLV
jgi:hypothetical protein